MTTFLRRFRPVIVVAVGLGLLALEPASAFPANVPWRGLIDLAALGPFVGHFSASR